MQEGNTHNTKRGTRQWSGFQSMSHDTTEPVDRKVNGRFKFIIVFNYTRTSKQKFPFVSEAKE